MVSQIQHFAIPLQSSTEGTRHDFMNSKVSWDEVPIKADAPGCLARHENSGNATFAELESSENPDLGFLCFVSISELLAARVELMNFKADTVGSCNRLGR